MWASTKMGVKYKVKRMSDNKHYYVTRDRKSVTHGLMNYLRCKLKRLLAHGCNNKVSDVETNPM